MMLVIIVVVRFGGQHKLREYLAWLLVKAGLA
jgi:hypothetical protein